MSEYTPTMDEIKGWYAGAVDEYRCDTGMSMDEGEAAFDRAIAAHDRELRERIAQDIEAYAVFLDRALYPASTFARIARGEDQTD